MTDFLLTDMPVWLLFAIATIGWAAVSVGLTYLISDWAQDLQGEGHNELTGTFFASIGALYALVLGFTVVTVWGSFDGADRASSHESAIIIGLYENTFTFPDPVRQITQQRLLAYADSVVRYEWPAMATGDASPQTTNALHALFHDFGVLRPTSAWERDRYQSSFNQLTELAQARSDRIQVSSAALPDIFWFFLLAGAVLTQLVFAALIMQRLGLKLLWAASLAAFQAATLCLIFVLDHPFAGEIHVQPGAILDAIRFISAS